MENNWIKTQGLLQNLRRMHLNYQIFKKEKQHWLDGFFKYKIENFILYKRFTEKILKFLSMILKRPVPLLFLIIKHTFLCKLGILLIFLIPSKTFEMGRIPIQTS